MSTGKTDFEPQRPILLSIGGVLLLALLCCACTLVVGWYTGDFFIDRLMQLGG